VIALLRTWRGRFIIAMVATQLLLPLHYYIARRDKHDERFAWRMFSPMRSAHCQPHVSIDGRPFALDSEFHEAWIELALRGRFVVVEAMGAKLCAEHPGSVVRVSLACTYLDRDPISYGGFDICQVPEL
jgi:hypothetical protein